MFSIYSSDWYLLLDLLLMPFCFLRWNDGHLLPNLGLELPQAPGTWHSPETKPWWVMGRIHFGLFLSMHNSGCNHLAFSCYTAEFVITVIMLWSVKFVHLILNCILEKCDRNHYTRITWLTSDRNAGAVIVLLFCRAWIPSHSWCANHSGQIC